MADVNLNSERAIQLKTKLGDYPAPTPENLAKQQEYLDVTGLREANKQAAMVDTIGQRLNDLSGLTGVGAGLPRVGSGLASMANKIKGLVVGDREAGLAANSVSKFYSNLDPLLKTEEGTPKTFYHGTNANFDEFRQMPSGSSKYKNTGYFFTSDPEFASAYAAKDGGNVIPVHLNASKLFDASTMSPLNKRNVSDQLVNRLKDEGYDGITGFRYPHEVVVFNPNQVKGAFNATPTFDSNNIMKSVVPGGLSVATYENTKDK